MLIRDAVGLFVDSRIALMLAQGTISNYRRFLDEFSETTTPTHIEEITPTHVRNHLTRLREKGLKDTTIEQRRVCIVTWLNWLAEEGHIDTSGWSKSVRSIRCHQRLPRFLTLDEVKRFLLTAENYYKHDKLVRTRNLAMLYMFLTTGVRRSELTNMKLSDIDLATRIATVREPKGKKDRRVKFSPATLRKLRAYLKERGIAGEWLWVTGGGDKCCSMLVYRIIRDVGRAAGLGDIYPHALRHTYATLMLDDGMPITSLQEALGHAKLSTTMRYVHMRGETALRDQESHTPVDGLGL